MIDGSENRNRQLAFELQNSHVCEKRSNSNWNRRPVIMGTAVSERKKKKNLRYEEVVYCRSVL